MPKTNFDKGRAERLRKLEKFREKPVKHPGRSLEELAPDQQGPGKLYRAGGRKVTSR